MARSIEEIKEVLRGLIRKEESARELKNLEEAEVFASKIQDLMLKYQIEINELVQSNQKVYQIIKKWINTDELTNRHESNWVVHLFAACATSAGCQIFTVQNNQMEVAAFGDETDVEALEFMVASLTTRLRMISRESYKLYKGPSKKNTYIRSFLKGACTGIHLRLKAEMNRQAQQYGLVLNKQARINEFIKESNTRVGPAKKSKAPGSNDGFRHGVTAGQNLNHEVKPRNDSKSIGQPSKLLGS
jgi:hypothetical protein